MNHFINRTVIVIVAWVLVAAFVGCTEDTPTEPETIDIPERANDLDRHIYSLPAVAPAFRNLQQSDESRFTGESQTVRDGEIFTCDSYERDYSGVSDRFRSVDENSDVVWPGSVIQGATLTRATHDPITAPRGPGWLVMTDQTGAELSSVQVNPVTLANTVGAINTMIRQAEQEPGTDVSLSITKVRTKEELQIALEMSASFFGVFGASSSFKLKEDERFSHFLVAFRQDLYDVVFQRPSLPHELWAPNTDLQVIAPHIGPDNPPAVVTRVTYGRVFYLLIESIEKDSDMETTLEANLNLGVFGADIGGRFDYLTELRDLRITAYAYGGNKDSALDAIFAGLSDLNTFKENLKNGGDLTTAKPVFYTVRSVATDELVRNGFSTGYTFRECVPVGSLCKPVLVSPPPNRVMDNGCRCNKEGVYWSFSWSGCPEADEYELQISHNQYGTITRRTGKTQDGVSFPDVVTSSTGWRWTVRSKMLGEWGPWASSRPFSVEAVDTDCKTGVELFEDDTYRAMSILLNKDNPNLENVSFGDMVSSVKLWNVKAVILYEHDNYRGMFYRLDHSCTDVERHNNHGFPHDIVSSIKIIRCN